MNRPRIVYQALWAIWPSRRRRWAGPQNLLSSSQAARRKDCAGGTGPTALLCAFTASLGLPITDGPVLWDGISNETAKVGSSDLCMLVDTLQPKASARCGGRRI